MLLFNLDDGQFVDRLHFGLVFLSILFSLLLRNPSNHFENIVIRIEVLAEVSHEVSRSRSVKRSIHAHELVACEELVEVTKQLVDGTRQSLHVEVNLVLLRCRRPVSTFHIRVRIRVRELDVDP